MTKRNQRDVTVNPERMAGGPIRGAPHSSRAVDYRMLGSLSEEDDAVQEA
jgi:hypothetical protein